MAVMLRCGNDQNSPPLEGGAPQADGVVFQRSRMVKHERIVREAPPVCVADNKPAMRLNPHRILLRYII